ncbi:hypothetical protein [Halolamina sp. C58]|uniref:hypothetical protein n=1 Tax=Halolamina sp. C58 TaxID=3421640 RepID=UPI003EB8CA71
MVHPHLLVLAAGLAVLPVGAELWSRYWGADPENWPERALIRTGSVLLILALVGFDGAFGLIPDPGVSPSVATAAELVLLALSLAAYAAFWYRRD